MLHQHFKMYTSVNVVGKRKVILHGKAGLKRLLLGLYIIVLLVLVLLIIIIRSDHLFYVRLLWPCLGTTT